VEVESFVESRKPDIVFYRESKPVGAIEVKVTHAVDEQKRIDLKRSGLPWLEVEASEDFYEGEDKWTPDKPLPYMRCDPPILERTCDRCLTAPAEHRARVYEAIAKGREDRRKEKERREDYERWRKEEIVPRTSSRSKPDKVNLVKVLRDESGGEIKYSVKQENDDSDTVLMLGDEVLASFPPQMTEVWKRLMDVYREHRKSLGVTYRDVTGWEPPIQVDLRRSTIL